MSRLAKEHKVLFVNSLGMRIPLLKKDKDALQKIVRKLRSMMLYLRKDENGMMIFTPISVPFMNNICKTLNRIFLSFQLFIIQQLLSIQRPIYYIGCLPAWDIVKKKKRTMLIYERTDIFEEMLEGDKPYLQGLNEELQKNADLILYVNRALQRQGDAINPNGLLLGHGVDYDLFSQAEKVPFVPEDIASIPKPIIGFFGDINGDWCDLPLLEHAAKAFKHISFVLVGPVSSNVDGLKSQGNVYFLGKKSYLEIPHYGKQFDVAIMPWKQNRWIEFCNPVKTKEYLALGKPIVSTDFPELKPYHDIVYAVSGYDEFVNAIQSALAENDPDLKRRRQERVKNETWDNKVGQILEFIEENLRIQGNE
jgi:glycosyltransferase involved in cell wall biosynthesis